jgi:hypothetical protein
MVTGNNENRGTAMTPMTAANATGGDLIDPNGNGSGLIARGSSVQQVRTQFCTAVTVQRPRQLHDVQRRLLEEARLMGEDAYYGWRVGTERVEGPSINLAVAAARCWGNCATDMMPVQDLVDSWIFTAAFIDLETGYTRTRQFRQSKKWTVAGRMDDERKDDIRFELGQSKAERNVILKALPSWLIAAALEAAKEGVRAELDKLVAKHGFATVTDRLIVALGKEGVKEEVVLAKCGVADRRGLTPDHLVVLRGDLKALQQGQERAETLFPALEGGAESQSTQSPQSSQSQQSSAGEEAGRGPAARRKVPGRRAEPPQQQREPGIDEDND